MDMKGGQLYGVEKFWMFTKKLVCILTIKQLKLTLISQVSILQGACGRKRARSKVETVQDRTRLLPRKFYFVA